MIFIGKFSNKASSIIKTSLKRTQGNTTLRMGNEPSQQIRQQSLRQSSQLRISPQYNYIIDHPILRYTQIAIRNPKVMSTHLPMKHIGEIQLWLIKLRKVRQLKCDHLLLPEKINIVEESVDGCYGQLQLQFPCFPYLLSDQIKMRANLSRKFEEDEIWYLLWVLAQSCTILHQNRQQIGDIRPLNILFNEQGQIKLVSQTSWPCQFPNFTKTQHDATITYLSPQQIQLIKKGQLIDSGNLLLSQSFSAGLTIMALLHLTDMSQLYTGGCILDTESTVGLGGISERNIRRFSTFGIDRDLLMDYLVKLPFLRFTKHQQQVKNLSTALPHQQQYSRYLLQITKSLCNVDPQKRLSLSHVKTLLQPYKNEIINFKPFNLRNFNVNNSINQGQNNPRSHSPIKKYHVVRQPNPVNITSSPYMNRNSVSLSPEKPNIVRINEKVIYQIPNYTANKIVPNLQYIPIQYSTPLQIHHQNNGYLINNSPAVSRIHTPTANTGHSPNPSRPQTPVPQSMESAGTPQMGHTHGKREQLSQRPQLVRGTNVDKIINIKNDKNQYIPSTFINNEKSPMFVRSNSNFTFEDDSPTRPIQAENAPINPENKVQISHKLASDQPSSNNELQHNNNKLQSKINPIIHTNSVMLNLNSTPLQSKNTEQQGKTLQVAPVTLSQVISKSTNSVFNNSYNPQTSGHPQSFPYQKQNYFLPVQNASPSFSHYHYGDPNNMAVGVIQNKYVVEGKTQKPIQNVLRSIYIDYMQPPMTAQQVIPQQQSLNPAFNVNLPEPAHNLQMQQNDHLLTLVEKQLIKSRSLFPPKNNNLK